MKSAVNQTQPAIVMEIPLKEDSNVYKLEDLEPNQSYNFQMRYMTEVRNNIPQSSGEFDPKGGPEL